MILLKLLQKKRILLISIIINSKHIILTFRWNLKIQINYDKKWSENYIKFTKEIIQLVAVPYSTTELRDPKVIKNGVSLKSGLGLAIVQVT